jgi:hypothetical protein
MGARVELVDMRLKFSESLDQEKVPSPLEDKHCPSVPLSETSERFMGVIHPSTICV